MIVVELKEDRNDYVLEGERYSNIKYYQWVYIKPYADRLEPQLRAFIDTGASISMLLFKDWEEIDKTMIPWEKVPELLKKLSSVTTNLNGQYAFIQIRFDETGEYLSLPVFLVRREDFGEDSQKLILGSMGFLEQRSMILLPAMKDNSHYWY